MAVCVNFNYPRTDLNGLGAGESSSCATRGESSVKLVGNGFTPQPFTALRVQAFPNGLTLTGGSLRPVDYRAQTGGTVAGWPHVAKAVAVPGPAGFVGVGYYILFGQIP